MSLIANALARLADIFDFVPYSNRNLFVDGAKDAWNISGGTSAALTTTGAYGPNVLQIVSAGVGGSGSYGRANAAPGPYTRLGWPRGPNNFGTFSQSVASTGTLATRTGPVMAMRIEDVNYLEGGSITFSVVLNNQSGTDVTITQLAAIQNFGSGGSPSANVATIIPVNWLVPADSTIWKRYSARIDLPSAAGKTMGTSNTVGWTQIEIDLPVGRTFVIQDAFWQAEFCSPDAPATGLPTAFEYRGQAAEQARIERYYEQWINSQFAVGGLNSATVAYCNSRFRTQKRAQPSITMGGTFLFYSMNTGNQNVAATSIVPSASPNGDAAIYTVNVTGATGGQACLLQGGGPGCSITFDSRM